MPQSRRLYFDRALIEHQWSDNVVITINDARISDIQIDVKQVDDSVENLGGIAIPGMPNAHSHAFQRAFAGLSEYRTSEHDSFWTWRKLMYEFLERLTPDDVYNIARDLYSDMLRAGYTSVGEFHYLHHEPDGTPYREKTAMADAVILAAIDVGMNICMLPVFYERGGFDGSPLTGGQLRFGCNRQQFLQIVEGLKQKWHEHHRVNLGIALHSLRAVSVTSASVLIADCSQMLPDCPIHIHVAEQTQEVDDCLAATGRRPVELLLESFDIDQRWCLVHATHMTDDECQRVAASGAVVCACPTTEANLGDGIFMADQYLNAGGRLAIGSDSHISVSPCSELRMLEYGQRLTQRRRAVLCDEQKTCGRTLYETSVTGGASVTGQGTGSIQVGQPANIIVLDDDHPLLTRANGDQVFDLLIFNETALTINQAINF